MDELLRRIAETMDQLDRIASGKRVRPAQRRALQDCRRMWTRVSRNIRKTRPSERDVLVVTAVARTCELLNAYFCGKG